jgi:hypothetical protein
VPVERRNVAQSGEAGENFPVHPAVAIDIAANLAEAVPGADAVPADEPADREAVASGRTEARLLEVTGHWDKVAENAVVHRASVCPAAADMGRALQNPATTGD